MKNIILLFFIVFSSGAMAKVIVNVENYEIAESDIAFNNITKLVGMNK